MRGSYIWCMDIREDDIPLMREVLAAYACGELCVCGKWYKVYMGEEARRGGNVAITCDNQFEGMYKFNKEWELQVNKMIWGDKVFGNI